MAESYSRPGDSKPEFGAIRRFSYLIVAVCRLLFFKVDFWVVKPGLAEFKVKADAGVSASLLEIYFLSS